MIGSPSSLRSLLCSDFEISQTVDLSHRLTILLSLHSHCLSILISYPQYDDAIFIKDRRISHCNSNLIRSFCDALQYEVVTGL